MGFLLQFEKERVLGNTEQEYRVGNSGTTPTFVWPVHRKTKEQPPTGISDTQKLMNANAVLERWTTSDSMSHL